MDFLKGRTNRATYWLMVAICVLLYGAANYFTGSTVSMSEVLLLIVAIPRLHDIGRSGWWAGGSVIALYVIVFGGIIVFSHLPLETIETALGFVTLVFFAAVIVLGCLPGQPFANRFGEPPAPGFLWKQPKAAPP